MAGISLADLAAEAGAGQRRLVEAATNNWRTAEGVPLGGLYHKPFVPAITNEIRQALAANERAAVQATSCRGARARRQAIPLTAHSHHITRVVGIFLHLVAQAAHMHPE